MRTLLLIFVFSFFGCQEISFSGKGKDVPTAGQVSIGFEWGDTFMVQQWLEIFHSQYPKATITPVYGNYSELTNLLLADSLHGVFMHDKFNKDQLAWLKQQKNSTVNEIELGTTSLVFITSRESQLENLKHNQIQSELFGSIFEKSRVDAKYKWALPSRSSSEWTRLSKFYSSHNYVTKTVANRSDSSASLEQKWINHNPGSHVRWISSHQDIINYVSRNPNTIGVVSLNCIADKKDSLALANSKNVKVLAVENAQGKFTYPFQSQISLAQYPFDQPVVSYEMQGYSGLITGFVLYCNSQAGQALMKKSGLLPKNYQGRKIELDLPN
jgi:phosphate transport system substrate-binding protein